MKFIAAACFFSVAASAAAADAPGLRRRELSDSKTFVSLFNGSKKLLSQLSQRNLAWIIPCILQNIFCTLTIARHDTCTIIYI